MFITRKHLSRRTLLKGAGVSLALPFLEAMVPAATAQARTAAAPALRVGFFYIPHGAVQGDTLFGPEGDRWTPSGSGSKFKLNAITQPLEPFKKYVTSIGNLENAACAGQQHIANPATWLSCVRPVGLPLNAGARGGPAPRGAGPGTTTVANPTPDPVPAGPNMAPTLDQIIAAHLKGETARPSLEVASETTAQQASGNGAPYTTLSFRDATTPLPMEYNPKKIFNALFGDGTPESNRQDAKENASLLDLINEQTRALKKGLGRADRAVLDDYLTSVRKTEKDVQNQSQRYRNITVPPRPVGVMNEFDQQVKLLFDLIAIAYQADLTRVVSYIMAAEGTNQTYNHVGVPDSFHPISHHANQKGNIEPLVKIQTWHMKAFADFLQKMSETPDGDGSLLDHSIFLYGSNMGNSDKHSNWPIPTVIVGGGNKKLKKGGRHIALKERTPLANVHLTLLNKIGIDQQKFADSTGMISEI